MTINEIIALCAPYAPAARALVAEMRSAAVRVYGSAYLRASRRLAAVSEDNTTERWALGAILNAAQSMADPRSSEALVCADHCARKVAALMTVTA